MMRGVVKNRGFTRLVDFGDAIPSRTKSASPKFTTGFTLLEMLLSVVALTIILGISIPIFLSFSSRNDLSIGTTIVVESLRRAQTLSRNMEGDSAWGVYIVPGEVVVFKGVNYLSRDINFDEDNALALSLTPSGVNEVVYSKFEGNPTPTGTITLTSNTNSVKNININAKGTISY